MVEKIITDWDGIRRTPTGYTAGDLHLPQDLRGIFPSHMGISISEKGVIFASQQSDCTGGRWVAGHLSGGVTVEELRGDIVAAHTERDGTY